MIRRNNGVMASAPDPLPLVPKMLKEIPNWVSWKLVDGDKPLFIVGTDQYASSTDSSTWVDYGTAVTKSTINGVEGVGFVIGGLAVEKEIVGVDIDGCLNPKTDEIAPWAEKIVDLMDSYTERTPSGSGLRVWVIGGWPFKEHVFNLDPAAGYGDKVKIEVYNLARYFTVTGDAWYEGEVTLERRDLTGLHNLCEETRSQYLPPKKTEATSTSSMISEGAKVKHTGTVITDKYELLMHGTATGDKPLFITDGFGNSVTYDDRSAADLALCTLSALKHGDNPDAIWEDYENSSLFRPKWEKREDDFRRLTIANGITTAKKINDASAASTATAPSSEGVAATGPATADPAAEEFVERTIEEKDEPLPNFTDCLSGSIAEYARAVEPDLPMEFKVMAAVTKIGLALSGRVELFGYDNLQPRFYSALVSPKWHGKSAAIEKMKLDNEAWYGLLDSLDSAPVLVTNFKERACAVISQASQEREGRICTRILLSPDELKDVFEKSKASKEAKGNIGTMLLKLFEGNRCSNNTKKGGNQVVDTAHLAMLGGCTPEGYYTMWQNISGAAGGLQSRFTTIGTNSLQVPQRRRPSDVKAATEAFARITNQVTSPMPVIYTSDEAEEVMADWWETVQLNEQVARLSDIIRRFLVVLAVTNDTDRVDVRLMEQGIDFGRHVLKARERFNPKDSVSNIQDFENRIETAFDKHGPMTDRMLMNAIHPERHAGGYGAFNTAKRNLADAGRIIPATTGGSSRKKFWRLVK